VLGHLAALVGAHAAAGAEHHALGAPGAFLHAGSLTCGEDIGTSER
jgi:hypothetical protein